MHQAFDVPVTNIDPAEGRWDVTIGSHPSEDFASYGTDCWLGELQIFSKALSYTRIQQLYGNGGELFM